MINEYINRWGLVPDGSLIVTNGGHLLPVQYNGIPAMLKVAAQEEEKLGAALMGWWRGEGAARVLAHEGAAYWNVQRGAWGSPSWSVMDTTKKHA